MFDPQKHLKDILDAAYQSGRAHAETIRDATSPEPDGRYTEQARDLHCEMLAGAVAQVPALDNITLKQGVFTSAFSGFEDRMKELRGAPRSFKIDGWPDGTDDGGNDEH